MNWRRGLVLAGINLAVALPMIGLLAARDAQSLREREQKAGLDRQLRARPALLDRRNAAGLMRTQEEQTVTFSPCGLWSHYPVQTYVVQFGDLPAFIVTQWQVACPPKWSIAARLGVGDDGWISEANLKAMRRVDVALCVLIVIQWFLIGGFPLIQPRRWWNEPGAFITVCTAIASMIALLPAVDGLAKLPALAAFFGWVWWLSLVAWKSVHWAWRSTVGGLRRLNN